MGRKEELSSAEITQQLDKLLQDKASNRRIFDWIEVGLNLGVSDCSFHCSLLLFANSDLFASI